ncbi:imidazole glycerol phosphate synthase subunit HisF [Buchnera aphidicola]|uniref:imidazole glycerol phosphate synthase subunit HisF n=1 Tax=Buchnera aphidicola TaxID=9 RepID=UPI0031B6824B
MLAKRIIPCLDVKNNQVVKGIQFKNHMIIGDILSLAKYYSCVGADELVFYDITASITNTIVSKSWITKIAKVIDIPFCVAGGINSIQDAELVLFSGADKLSINTPALNNPNLISQLSNRFGSQCIVVGVDSWYDQLTKEYFVFKYTGNFENRKKTLWKTIDWVKYVQKLGAGEIVLNSMNCDGLKKGFDLKQLKKIRKICKVPLIASGGAGSVQDFLDVFNKTKVDGALAASILHKKIVSINSIKKFLKLKGVEVRI